MTDTDLTRKLTLAVDQSPAAIFVTDTSGTIEYVNARFTESTGYSREEAVGKNPRLLQSGLTPRETYHALWSRIRAGGIWKSEIQNRRKHGELYWDAVTISPIRDPDGTVTHFLAVQQDITERKREQEALVASERRLRTLFETVNLVVVVLDAEGKLEYLNPFMLQLTGYSREEVIGHGWIERFVPEEERAGMLKESLAGDQRLEDVEPILSAGEAATTLTRQLLAFSRQQVIQPRAVQLEALLAQSEKLLRRVIGEDVTLHTKGGRLSIESSVVDLDEEYARSHWPATPGRFAMLVMTDTGIGMDGATRRRIFEPFFTTKEVGRGTGLGLATVYGIVKQSGGFIWVYSEPGQGTTFKIYLPLVDQASDPLIVHRPAHDIPRGSETLLLLEDSAAVRAAARQILECAGYTVLEAASGRAALDLTAKRAGPIHLLLTDVVMPEMSGKQLAEQFKLVRPGSRVLYMSGYTDDAIVRHGVLEAGIAYLQKPFTPKGLARRVREALDARQEGG